MPTRMKIDDWYKATIADDGPPKIVNPKVNLKMLPFEFMQAVCKKLHLDDSILRLSDAPSESEYRLTQALSTEASGWVRSIMSSYGIIDRVYVGVSRRVRCFFAVVSFEKWTDLEVRNALVSAAKRFKSLVSDVERRCTCDCLFKTSAAHCDVNVQLCPFCYKYRCVPSESFTPSETDRDFRRARIDQTFCATPHPASKS